MQSDESQSHATALALKYDKDLDAKKFCKEIKRFKVAIALAMPNLEKASSIEILEMLYKKKYNTLYPNVEKALRIFLTLPVTTASCERSFSKLKLIKNYLRSCMEQGKLSNVAIISIEHAIACAVNFDDIIDKFASKKARRVSF